MATKTVGADPDGMLSAWRWAHTLACEERVWALEDCRHVSGRLERCLVGQGERVVRVAPRLMGQTRRSERRPGKSDEIDAVAVARAAIKEGVDELPVAFLDEPSFEIRLLTDHRDDLVAERTRHQNRLRWHLVELDPDLEAELPARALDRACWIERVSRRLTRPEQTAGCGSRATSCAGSASSRVPSGRSSASSRPRSRQLRPDVLAEDGIGAITAATLIGHTAGAARFPTDGHFARLAGAARSPPRRDAPNASGSTAAATASSTRTPPDRGHPCPHVPQYPRIPRPQAGRGQNQRRGLPLPQTPPGPPRLAPTLPHPRPKARSDHDHPLQHANNDVGLDIGASVGRGSPGRCMKPGHDERLRRIADDYLDHPGGDYAELLARGEASFRWTVLDPEQSASGDPRQSAARTRSGSIALRSGDRAIAGRRLSVPRTRSSKRCRGDAARRSAQRRLGSAAARARGSCGGSRQGASRCAPTATPAVSPA